MGAALTQHPADYRAVVGLAGVYDMLRLKVWPNEEYNTRDYGTVTNAAEFAWLNAYSPVQHVRPGAAYPAVLLIAGENDPRVPSWQSGKFAAMLQVSVKLFGKDMTKQSALMHILEDQQEHLGQSIAYARSNGVVPPWSK